MSDFLVVIEVPEIETTEIEGLAAAVLHAEDPAVAIAVQMTTEGLADLAPVIDLLVEATEVVAPRVPIVDMPEVIVLVGALPMVLVIEVLTEITVQRVSLHVLHRIPAQIAMMDPTTKDLVTAKAKKQSLGLCSNHQLYFVLFLSDNKAVRLGIRLSINKRSQN